MRFVRASVGVGLFLLGIPSAFACSCVIDDIPHGDSPVTQTSWIQAGNALPDRKDYAVASFKNRLWLIGGIDERKMLSADVFSSVDGKKWEKTGRLPAGVSNHAVAVFKGKLWVLGGENKSIVATVFSSKDGKTWKKETNLPLALDSLQAVEKNGRLFVIGGHVGGTERPTRKVFATRDGVTWTEQGKDALPLALFNHAAVAFKGKLFVLGGGYPDHGDPPSRHVFTSADGAKWETLDNALPAGMFCLTAASFQGKLWLLGGIQGDVAAHAHGDNHMHGDDHGHDMLSYRHVTLSSTDGRTWKEETAAPIPVHSVKNTSAVFKNALWAVGGAHGKGVYSLGR